MFWLEGLWSHFSLSIFQPNNVLGPLHPDGVIVTVVHHDPPSWIFLHDLSHLPSHTLYHPYCQIILPLPPQHTLQHLQIVRNITEWQDSLSRGHVCLFFDGSELLWQIMGGEGQPTRVIWVHYKQSQGIFWLLAWTKASEVVRILGYCFEPLTLTRSFCGSMNIGIQVIDLRH